MTTSIAQQLGQQFLDRFDANDIDGAVSLFADDVRYWLAGKPEQLPAAGWHDKQQMQTMFGRMASRLENGQRMRAIGVVADGERAAFEVECEGTLKNGRLYRNQYHMLFEVKGGRIAVVKEYMDTLHVHTVWFQA